MRALRIPLQFQNGEFLATSSIAEIVGDEIRTICMTYLGQRVMEPQVGSTLLASVFEANNEASSSMVSDDLTAALKRQLIAGVVTNVDVSASPQEPNVVVVHVSFDAAGVSNEVEVAVNV